MKEKVENGNMANTMDELKELGKEMAQKHESDDPRESDPIQFDRNDKKYGKRPQQ